MMDLTRAMKETGYTEAEIESNKKFCNLLDAQGFLESLDEESREEWQERIKQAQIKKETALYGDGIDLVYSADDDEVYILETSL